MRPVLVAGLIVWLALGVAAIYAHDGHLNHHHNAVRGSPPWIKYSNFSSYAAPVRHARSEWNGVARANEPHVKVKQSGEIRTLLIYDKTTHDAYLGIYKNSTSNGPIIYLNACWLGKPDGTTRSSPCDVRNPDLRHNLDADDEKRVGAHEFGHALCLADRTDREDVLMDNDPTNDSSDPMGPVSRSGSDGDIDHFHLAWDPRTC